MTAKTREQLINELQAYHNKHGEVPGRRRFEENTGVTPGQYLKHWARWSDFVNDAGLRPNSPREKSDKETLLGRLAEVTRTLKKFPTVPELRIQRQNDKTVPSDDTLRKHFGDNKKLRAALYHFCQEQGELSDVVQLFSAEIDEDEHDEGDPAIYAGIVYLHLMRIGNEKRYKIGRTNNSDVRHKQISATLPENLERLHEIETDDAVGIERYWHQRFATKRRKGEWFDLSNADVTAFKRRRFQ